MGHVLKPNNPATYKLRTRKELYSRNPKTVRYGTKLYLFWPLKIWTIVFQKI